PVHLHRRAYVRDACRDVVAEARRRGMPWWTAARLNAWERLRRSISLDVRRIGQSAMEIDVTAPAAVEGLTVLLALPGPAAEANVSITGPVAVKHALVERHGRKMHELIADVPEGTTALRIGWPGAG